MSMSLILSFFLRQNSCILASYLSAALVLHSLQYSALSSTQRIRNVAVSSRPALLATKVTKVKKKYIYKQKLFWQMEKYFLLNTRTIDYLKINLLKYFNVAVSALQIVEAYLVWNLQLCSTAWLSSEHSSLN